MKTVGVYIAVVECRPRLVAEVLLPGTLHFR
jgi:hypothetical protein